MIDIDFLVITPPKVESFYEAVFHGVDRWKINLVDRDALELCAFLQSNNYTVEYIPLNLLFPYYTADSNNTISELINKYNPKYIIDATFYLNEGVMYSTLKNILREKKAIKKDNAKLIAIGNFAEYFEEKLLLDNYIFAGSYNSFYSALNERKIDSIHVQNKFEEFKYLPAYELLKDYLDIITCQGRGKLNMYLKTSSGCPYYCAFCSTNNKYTHRIKYASCHFFMEEIKKIDQCFGVTNINFDCIVDDSFGLDYEKSMEFIDIIRKQNIKVDYVLMRADIIIKHKLLLREIADVSNYILIGVETLNDRILKKVGKQETVVEILSSLLIVKRYGLKTHLNWIVGLPGENHDNLFYNLKAMAFLLRTGIADEIEPQIFVPFPWTDIYQNQEGYGVEILEREACNYEESGFISCVKYNDYTNNEIERAYMLSKLVCEHASKARWPNWKLEELVSSNGESLKKMLDFIVQKGDSDIIFKTVKGGIINGAIRTKFY